MIAIKAMHTANKFPCNNSLIGFKIKPTVLLILNVITSTIFDT
jgi:hypothetical protein